MDVFWTMLFYSIPFNYLHFCFARFALIISSLFDFDSIHFAQVRFRRSASTVFFKRWRSQFMFWHVNAHADVTWRRVNKREGCVIYLSCESNLDENPRPETKQLAGMQIYKMFNITTRRAFFHFFWDLFITFWERGLRAVHAQLTNEAPTPVRRNDFAFATGNLSIVVAFCSALSFLPFRAVRLLDQSMLQVFL